MWDDAVGKVSKNVNHISIKISRANRFTIRKSFNELKKLNVDDLNQTTSSFLESDRFYK